MYTPTFKTSRTNVPILSKSEIDTIGEELIQDFCPQAMETPMEIDVDRFITNYLGMEQDFQYLSHCGLYLGMTVFNDTDMIPVFNFDKWQAEFISAKAGTIFIDVSLLDPTQDHRYRFTAGHEAAHGILHGPYFSYDPNQTCMYDDRLPMVQCRADSTKVCKPRFGPKRTDRGWMEWQANCLSSALLMPRKMVILAARRAERRSNSANAALEAVASIFNVSNEAAYYRLIDLGLIQGKKRA